METQYEQRTRKKLIELFSKDEVVALLVKKISDLEFECGQYKAEVDFLKHELVSDKKNETIKAQRKTIKEMQEKQHNDIYFNKYREQKTKIAELEKTIDDLIFKLNNK